MEKDCLFCKISAGEMGTNFEYENESVVVFKDINPQAQVHILVVPNVEIRTSNDLTEQDEQLAGRMVRIAVSLAREAGIAEDGYRLIINCNRHGGQVISHLHLHLLGGNPLGPMVV